MHGVSGINYRDVKILEWGQDDFYKAKIFVF